MVRRFALIMISFCASMALAQQLGRQLDPSRSLLTIHASKSGVFSFAGHDHTIQAPIAQGTLNEAVGSIEFTVNVADMRVLDPDESEKNRTEIRNTMLSDKLLDSQKFPNIAFHSTSVKVAGSAVNVEGLLTIHGVTKPVSLTAHKDGATYTGSTKLKQTTFGLTPVSVGGGTVKVKDELTIDFTVVPR